MGPANPAARVPAPVPPDRTPPRERAVRALVRVEQDAAYAARLGTTFGDGGAYDARDARFVTEIVAGVTRQRRWLDFLLGSAYRADLALMEPALRNVLRVGLYERLFLGTPDHAAVSEAVALARRLVRPGAAGLVNAVLRALQRGPVPRPASGDVADDLAVLYSHPTWLVRRWLERFGPVETEVLLAVHNERPVHGVRVNVRRTTVADFTARVADAGGEVFPSAYLDDAVRAERLQAVLPSVRDGLAAVQDEAAALVVRVLDPQPGETVFDVCAAPGGKALYAATRMDDRGRLVASDLHAGRVRLVAKAAAAHGLSIVETLAAGVEDRVASGETADAVLLDAPCTGTGVLARRADLRWARTPDDLDTLARLQTRLLGAAAALVRPGGRLVYSTCSLEPEENEQQVARFLAAHPDFRLEPPAGRVPDAFVTPEGFYAALPHVHGTDGAFAARLVRSV